MTKHRLLVMTDWFPPGFRAGGPIRSTANLVGVLQHHCDVRVVTRDRDFGSDHPYPDTPAGAWLPYAEKAMVVYLPPSALSPTRIRKMLQECRADCVYLNSMFSPYFTLIPLWLAWGGRGRGRVVVAPRGMLHANALRSKSAKKRVCLAALRAAGIGAWARFHATDEQECRDIQSRLGVSADRVTVLPNLPQPPVKTVASIIKEAGVCRLLFLSRIVPHKRLLVLLEALRLVPSGMRISLTVAGPREEAGYWQQCRGAIARLPQHVTAQCLDAVPHAAVQGLIESHHFYVLPTLGENYGHAIVEALGAGRPVIISDQTPWRNLQAAGVGWDINVADTATLVATITAATRLSQIEYNSMVNAAWAYATKHVTDATVIDGYKAMLGPM